MRDKLYQRLGWQPRCKPTVLPSGRILLPLYTDTFSISIMAVSDDDGKTWYASKPLLGFGAIQPAVLRRDSGELVAYMRENGVEQRIRSSYVEGRWPKLGAGNREPICPILVRDSTACASPTAIGCSSTTIRRAAATAWRFRSPTTKERPGNGNGIWKKNPRLLSLSSQLSQGRDGTIHAVYSYFVDGGKSMKHAAFNEAWVQAQ